MRLSIFFLFFFISITAFTQKTEIIYRTKGDTLQNYYTALIPDSASKGLLIILGGFCTSPAEVMQETNLPVTACKAGYTVIMPFLINDCDSIELNNAFEKRLEILIPELVKKYNPPADKFIIGGQSLGGHRALFYAEQAYKLNDSTILKPNLVFAVDPPLNMKRLWNSFTYGVKIKFKMD